MSQKNAPDNVIQFPGPRREAEAKEDGHKPPARKAPVKKKTKAKNVAGTVLAIMLATVAVNQYVFESSTGSVSMASNATGATARGIASVGNLNHTRDADWEKELAERLASSKTRGPASAHIGRDATAEERLRWGTLEEKYTFIYRPEEHSIRSILLQDASSHPSYVLDRQEFLESYGHLLERTYNSARLKSVEKIDENTVEAYTIFDSQDQTKAEVRFELDRHKRLLSLKVDSQQI